MSIIEAGEREFTRLLSPSVGYGIVVGVGLAFAVFGLTWLQGKYTDLDAKTAGEFTTAGQSVKPGLICCGIVSSWTWSATLLVSSTATYQSGVSAAWWYGVGGTIQIAFFSMIAAKVKMNANGASTFLQIVKARYGTASHVLFTIVALVCIHIVSGSLVLGASSTVNAMTGMPIVACNFLLPIVIAAYVVAGGLRATFWCDFLHTICLFVIIYMFLFNVFGTSEIVGSPGRLWELLQESAIISPVAGNAQGSYTTFKSNSGILFAANTVATGFSGVFCDQGYWQRAIASRPDSTTKSYLLGAVSWFAVPFSFGTVLGLSGRALLQNPEWPTYPYALSAAQQSAGLVAPAAAVALLGSSGAVAVLLVTYMAATSAASAELIAFSTIFVYDIVGTYFKPLTGTQVVRWSHASIVVFSIWLGAWATILSVAGIDLGWLFYVQGTLLTPAVIPIGLTVCWERMSKQAAMGGTLFGAACAMVGWMVGCTQIYGKINIANLALPYSAICGAAPGLVMSGIVTLLLAWIYPGSGNWSATRAITQADSRHTTANSIFEEVETGRTSPQDSKGEKGDGVNVTLDSASFSDNTDEQTDRAMLQKSFVRAAWLSGALCLVITFLIPFPLFFSEYIFSRGFFTFWIAIAIIWVLIAGGFCMLLPVWESRSEIYLVSRQIVRTITGHGRFRSSKDATA